MLSADFVQNSYIINLHFPWIVLPVNWFARFKDWWHKTGMITNLPFNWGCFSGSIPTAVVLTLDNIASTAKMFWGLFVACHTGHLISKLILRGQIFRPLNRKPTCFSVRHTLGSLCLPQVPTTLNCHWGTVYTEELCFGAQQRSTTHLLCWRYTLKTDAM